MSLLLDANGRKTTGGDEGDESLGRTVKGLLSTGVRDISEEMEVAGKKEG